MSDQWRKRWQEGRIGFHLQQAHPALLRHWASLGVAKGTKVLVPLCGKSLDMRWLADEGYPVLGIEFAPEAIEQFLAQRSTSVSRYSQADFTISRQGSVELWCGDFFHLHIQQAAEIGAFYDRASLIALPPATRQRYAFHLAQLVPPGAKGLLISLSHPEGSAGPPYSVPNSEIESLFTPNFTLTFLEQGSPDERGRTESVWALERRGPRL
ncbi:MULTISPECIES: thiopurine S-methyltransferase [Halomonadaceae]|jgi:thiopurine S-methyltransferase|uniref:thiopurine S-methyltransferase n=1 Tax=Halomonadaceae TaxID=28256 RepID=UPI0012F22FDC|nr:MULTISPECIES: thiopurine S-methyltransferase [Halomonas]CAD5246941.1 Thiopurine S-methyltransferase [Halomonas sp. 59]CAD5247079.1 Thiopurine S-methyltransferase [Halomonas sp. 113]CAD5252809.1 Thiopurine S-methyltransferase [Halomonas sp. 156]CAD5289753.1 Thiopurine S-methyltransferase [Halomonas sp. I3]VXB93693.1 Thiopurine S-methyltransferase [Halomonas titanicae]